MPEVQTMERREPSTQITLDPDVFGRLSGVSALMNVSANYFANLVMGDWLDGVASTISHAKTPGVQKAAKAKKAVAANGG